MQGKSILLFAFCIFVPLVVAGRVTFHSRHCAFSTSEDCISNGWVQQRRAHNSDLHTIVIAVKKPSDALAACDSELEAVANPKSPRYGQYYSLEELRELPLFDEKASAKVQKYLNKKGFEFEITANGDFIRVTDRVDKLEDLLKAKFYVFNSATASKQIMRTSQYSLPKKVISSISNAM
jgi:subtilase family serine protease